MPASAGWRRREVHRCWHLTSGESGEKKEAQMTDVRGTVLPICPAKGNPGLLRFLRLTFSYWLSLQYSTWYLCFMKPYRKVYFVHFSSYSWFSVTVTDTFSGGSTLTGTHGRSQSTYQHGGPALPFTTVSSFQRLKPILFYAIQQVSAF